MKIAIVTDMPRIAYLPGEEGMREDEQKRKTVQDLQEVISKKYECIDLVFAENITSKLVKENVDLVFNLCNGIIGDTKLAQFPAFLEYEGIPYTGSSILGHTLAYNKVVACNLFKSAGIATPKFIAVYDINDLDNHEIQFPVLVKPCDEGSSRGIHEDSLIFDMESLKNKVAEELILYNPPIMVCEYIEGREFSIGILGNGKQIEALPILEVDFENLPSEMAGFYSFEVKSYYKDKTVYKCPAPLEDEVRIKIEGTAKKAFNTLMLRDYARVDIRLKDNVPYVVEVNSLPGLQKGRSAITRMAAACELGYEGLVLRIIEIAVKRYEESIRRVAAAESFKVADSRAY